ncbi:MAG: PspC domain-containing protein [Allosphingosinicella sp.]
MQTDTTNLIARSDTFLGVCEALGEDFGINSNWFRIAFAVSLLLNPKVVVLTYLGLAVIVFLSRLVVPNRRWRWFSRRPATSAMVAEAPAMAEPQIENDNAERMPVAA